MYQAFRSKTDSWTP